MFLSIRLAALAAVLLGLARAPAQIILVEDRRHVELSANGDAGLDTCADLDEQEPEPFGPSVASSVRCSTHMTSAAASARLDSEFFDHRLVASGVSHASAAAGPDASASAFATAHYLVTFRLDAAAYFRLTGLFQTGSAGEFVARITNDAGEHTLDQSSSVLALLRESGSLPPGLYTLELEGASLAADPAGDPAGDATFRARLDVSAVPLCEADFDADGAVTPDDFVAYVAAYFAESPGGEVDQDHSGDLNADDLGEFINAYFAACEP